MTDEQIMALLRAALAEVAPARAASLGDLGLSVSLVDLGLDSVSMLEIFGFIEEELDVMFEDDALVGLEKVEDLARLIREVVAA